ncbi:MAG: BON domain-containing protein [Acidimicrobiales bacterium]
MRSGSSLGTLAERPGQAHTADGGVEQRRGRWRRRALLLPTLGLPVLFALGMGPGRASVEGDLAGRTADALLAAGFEGFEVDARGLHVTVSGAVADAAEAAEIRRLAEQVRGVRSASVATVTEVNPGGTGGLTIGQLSGMDLDVLLVGGKLVLRGDVASQPVRQALVSAAADTKGADAVLDQLTVSGRLAQPPLSPDARAEAALRTLLAVFADRAGTQTTLHVGPDLIELRGNAPDADSRRALGDAAVSAAGAGIEVRNLLIAPADIDGDAPAARPAEAGPPPTTAPPTTTSASSTPAGTTPAGMPTTTVTAPTGTAAPAVAPIAPQHFVVHFASESTTPSAAELAPLLAAAGTAPAGTEVRIVGFADPFGDAAYNRALSAQRAAAVADAVLAANGALSVQVTAEGADAATTGSPSAEQRRVEITIG